jgi:hypothetical protein
MPQIIPFDTSGERDEFDTELDGVRVTFVARWNPRADNSDANGVAIEGAWFFDLLNERREPLIYGVRVSTGVPLARWMRHPLTQFGCFIAADASGRYVDPGRYDLGQRVQLLYYTEDEIAGAVAEANR